MTAGGTRDLFVKICGITRLEDAELCIEAGATAIGLNFVPSSRRRVDEAGARRIVERVRGRIMTVAVVADLDGAELSRLALATGVERLQLHGHESPADVRGAGPNAFKAVRIGSAADAADAAAFPGEWLLVDAPSSGGELGGTGTRFDWSLVRELARSRATILAGGLHPGNVAEAVLAVGPFGVDVASGVESAPGRKDPDKVRAFVAAARSRTAPG